MKQCKKCNSMVATTAKFCANCGSPEFIEDPGATTVLDQSMLGDSQEIESNKQTGMAQSISRPDNYQQPTYQQPTYQQPTQQPTYQQPTYQQPTPQRPIQQQMIYQQSAYQQMQTTQRKKGLRWWHILLIVLGGIGVLAGLAVLIGVVLGGSKIPYTKGTFDGTVYTNEWANIEYKSPEDYEEGNDAQYQSFEGDGKTDCGLYLVSPDEFLFAIAFEDISGMLISNEEEYLTSLEKTVMEDSDEFLNGVEYRFVNNGAKTEIAGEKYNIAHVEFIGEENELLLLTSYYVRKIDDKMCIICVMSRTESENLEMVKQIEKVQ